MSLRKVQTAAARCLAAVESGHNLRAVLAEERRRSPNLSDSERAALIDLAYGTQRFSGNLKFFLDRLTEKPLRDKKINALLRVALYQLDRGRSAPHAVVDEAVTAVQMIAGGRFRALTNAVLRRFLRERESLKEALAGDEARHNLPAWWLARLRRDFPERAQSIIDVSLLPPPMTLRVNRRLSDARKYAEILRAHGAESTILDDFALILNRPVPVRDLPGFSEGMVSVQDFGAQRAVSLLAPRDGERVLDACAAPGGKSGHILEWADCELTALDIDETRLESVRDNLRRLGLRADLRAADAGNTAVWFDGRAYDAVLADLPCTASGTIRRNPDIKWLRRPDDAGKTAAQQQTLLDALWGTLKPGGRMLTATCSLFREENENQKNAFAARHPDARPVAEEQYLPDLRHDGFYYVLFEKD